MKDTLDEDNQREIAGLVADAELQRKSAEWMALSAIHRYSYHFRWMGRPIIQYPQDIMALQEIIWNVKPQLIIETGIAHGGSLIFSASMLELLGGNGSVVGIDIDIRLHNRKAIEEHQLFKRISLIEGSSIDDSVVHQVHQLADGKHPILVILDSNHTHEHVKRELELYSPLVPVGSYLIVFDTVIEDLPAGAFSDRPWGKGDNPKTAVREFLQTSDRFVVDKEVDNKLLLTVAPSGYLKCVKA
jgi:cephalosporin hydroxylase